MEEIIKKSDIVGARITDVHSTSESLDGYDCTTIYFTVDRGFSFTMPAPGYPWTRTVIPSNAARLPDEYIYESFKVKRILWLWTRFVAEPSKIVDTIKRIKRRTITGVHCPKMDEELGFYPPDDSVLIFDDGSRAFCVVVAPHGVGATGLHYRTEIQELPDLSEFVNIFDIPLENNQRREP